MNVADAVSREAIDCLFGGVIELRRAGQPPRMQIGEGAQIGHDLRSRKRLLFDAVDDRQVDAVLREKVDREG
jgi:hypothetical protein